MHLESQISRYVGAVQDQIACLERMTVTGTETTRQSTRSIGKIVSNTQRANHRTNTGRRTHKVLAQSSLVPAKARIMNSASIAMDYATDEANQ